MHIFEYLGKELPFEAWNRDKVYNVIKSRLDEIHLLEISHNDVTETNIQVSESGIVSLIDFGLSEYPRSEEHISNDIISLKRIFRQYTHDNDSQGDPATQKSKNLINDKSFTHSNYEIDDITSNEVDFDEMSSESHTAATTQLEKSKVLLQFNV